MGQESKGATRSLWIRIGISAILLGVLPFVPSAEIKGRSLTWIVLIPPMSAVVLALLTRRLLLSLGGALVIGALLHNGLGGVGKSAKAYVWDNATDSWHLYIIGFTLALLCMVSVAARSGGTAGIVRAVSGRIRSPRSTKIGTALLGLLIFFDDYANCMLVGPTMRPLTDKYGVSREKLSYLVDSTAAPVAGIAVVSTWVGYEVGLITDAAKAIGLTEGGYGLLLLALPFRFYCVFALAFLLATSLSGRDFGPMLRAERRAALERKPLGDDAQPLSQEADNEFVNDATPRWINAALPIATVVFGALLGLVYDGGGLPKIKADPGVAFSSAFWRTTLGGSENNVQMLLYAALAGAVVAILLPLVQRELRVGEALKAFLKGARTGLFAVVVLLLAWGLAQVCKDLGAGPLIGSLLSRGLPTWTLPIATFFAGAAIAFATGTSWGTMAILIPIVMPIAHTAGGEAIMLISMAAVLDGAIYGDHCSPISDTTLMSSIASGSDHIHHVATQLPYASTAMAVAALCGYIPVSLGWSVFASYAIGFTAIVAIVAIVGRSVPMPDETAQPASET